LTSLGPHRNSPIPQNRRQPSQVRTSISVSKSRDRRRAERQSRPDHRRQQSLWDRRRDDQSFSLPQSRRVGWRRRRSMWAGGMGC